MEVDLNNAYDYVSIISYVMIWIITILLLKGYSEKFGKIRYWILVSIPLVYYLAEDRLLLVSSLNQIALIEPVLFGIVHTIFFSAVQLVGGLLFGIAFFVAAKRIKQENISTSLKVSGIGIIVLIGSNEIFGVYVGAYPPFGLVSLSYLPLACYLLFVGILSSAVLIANNLRIRAELYKMADRQPVLFRDMGIAEMKWEMETKVDKILESTTVTQENRGEFVDDIVEMKKYAEEVLVELQKSDKFKK